MAAKAHEIGPYSRPPALQKLDGRTKEARLLAWARQEFTAHVGGSPTATQRALIDRAAQLTLRLAVMDATAAEKGTGSLSEADSRSYLAWSNSLVRTLRELGPRAVMPPAGLNNLADRVLARARENAELTGDAL